MNLIDNILRYSSISIIGTEKNTGKTETLNYILTKLRQRNIAVALTSIGTDGERVDAVTFTTKPEITLYPGDIFITTESYYRHKSCSCEVLSISQRRTSLGRLVIARALTKGNCIISGPNTNPWLREMMDEVAQYTPAITIIDGALSKKSSASPFIAEGIVLATGAAYSLSISEIAKNVQFLTQLIHLPKVEERLLPLLENLEGGIYCINEHEEIIDLAIPSALLLHQHKDGLFAHGHTLYLSGMATEGFFKFMASQKGCEKVEVWLKDFTKIFASPLAVNHFLQRGGKIKLLYNSQLLAITVNPTSPNGYTLHSQELIGAVQQATHVQVINVRK